jgi:hypothetical protein
VLKWSLMAIMAQLCLVCLFVHLHSLVHFDKIVFFLGGSSGEWLFPSTSKLDSKLYSHTQILRRFPKHQIRPQNRLKKNYSLFSLGGRGWLGWFPLTSLQKKTTSQNFIWEFFFMGEIICIVQELYQLNHHDFSPFFSFFIWVLYSL